MAEIEFVIEGDDDPIKKTFDDVIENVKRVADATEKYTDKQKSIIDGVGQAYKESIGEALTAFEAMDPVIKRLSNSLSEFEQEGKKIAKSQSELSRSLKSGSINQEQYLKATQALNVQQAENNRRISETTAEINRLDTAERKAIGSIAEKTARLTQLKKKYDELSESQRKNASVGGVIQKEYRALSADIEKANASLSGSSKSISTMLGSLKGIAGAVGVAFGTAQVVQFGMEIFEIAKQVSGVQVAFARLGAGEEGLEKLRQATRGTVDDLKLMQLAIDANNFKIPLDVFAKGLEFAQRRAQDTGKSIDYMVESFVTGMGRKSTVILDNLGISIIEIQNEVQKVGDFNKAVGNIIDREMARSGDAVDTFGSKVSNLTTLWENFKIGLAKISATVFDTLDEKRISDIIARGTKQLEGFEKANTAVRNKVVQDKDAEIKATEQAIIKNKAYQKLVVNYKTRNVTDKNLAQLQKEEKTLVENLRAQKSILSVIQDQNKALNKEERIKKGLVSDVELEEQILKLKERASEVVIITKKDEEYKNGLLKESIRLQKQLDSRNGKTDTAANTKAAREAQAEQKRLQDQRIRDEEKYSDLLQKYADVNTSYLNKQLSNDEQEIKSVQDKYATLERELKEYNEKTLASKINLDKFEADKEASLTAVRNKQAFEAEQRRLDEQLALWSDYENTKKRIGEERAKEMYASQLDFAKTYEQQLQDSIAQMQSKSNLTGQEEDQLKVLQDRLKKQQELNRQAQNEEFINALEASKTYNERRLEIERQYQERVKALGDKATKEQLEVLNRNRTQEVSNITMDELVDDKAWVDVFDKIMDKTNSDAKKAVSDLRAYIKSMLDAGLLSIKDYEAAIEGIKNVEIKISTTKRGFEDLKGAIKLFKEAQGMAKEDALGNLANIANGYIQGIIGIGNEINGIFDQLGVGSEKFREDLGLSLDALSSAAGAAASFASGDIIGGITQTIQAVSKVINIFSKDRKLERAIKEKQVAVEQLDAAFQKLQNSIDNSVGESFYKDSQAQIKNLEQQKRLTEQMMKAEQSKKKADAGKVKAYKDAIAQIDIEIKNIEKNISETLVQTTFKDFSDSLTEAFRSAFENGEGYIDALNNTFDDFIKNAITNSLKLKLIEPIIKQMIDTVSAYMKTNDNSLAGFSFEEWRNRLGDVGQQFTNALAELYKNLGLETAKQVQEEGGLQGAIRREMTEATASELTGLFRSQYDLQKRSFELSQINSTRMFSFFNQSLLNLNAIQTNTANTVSRLEEAVGQLTIVANNTSSLKEKYVI